MSNYTHYNPDCSKITSFDLSQEDWELLLELAEENNVSPELFAIQMISSELSRYRDELALVTELMHGASTLLNAQD